MLRSKGLGIFYRSFVTRIMPIGLDDFREIRQGNLLYVDKTSLLYQQIVGTKVKFHAITRPRRFGKSLLCSTIKELFKGDGALFEGLYIYDKWDFKKEMRPVLHLKLSNLGLNAESILSELSFKLDECAIDNGYMDYYVKFKERPVASKLRMLIRGLHEHYGKRVVVIIDEYDAPMHDLIYKPAEQQAIVQEELATFFGVLKEVGEHLRLVYLTGILKYSSLSLFSKLNCLKDHSFSIKLGTLCGYTEKEVLDNFQPELKMLAEKLGCSSVDDTVSVLQRKYNGYRFGFERTSDKLSDPVFNPFSLNIAFDELDLGNSWVESGSSKFIAEKILATNCWGSLLKTQEVPVKDLTNLDSLESISVPALMYFSGYSTLVKHNHLSETLTFAAPNDDITEDLISSLTTAAHQLAASGKGQPLN